MEDKNNNQKQEIKAFIVIGPNTSGVVAHKRQGNTYNGFSWDLYKKIMEVPFMKEKYIFKNEYSEFGWTNYSKTVQDVANGKYDIGISGFLHTAEREQIVDFTSVLTLDPICIFHLKKNSEIAYAKLILTETKTLFIIIILLGIVLGFILYFGNSDRIKKTRARNKYEFFMRSMMTGIASMFGELGFVSENASLTVKGLLVAFVVMLISFIFLTFIQARFTSILVDQRLHSYDKYSIRSGKSVLGHYGDGMSKNLADGGVKIKFMKNKTNDQLLELYLKNPDKYKGFALPYCDGYPYLSMYPELVASTGFGNMDSGWPVNSKNHKFLGDINNAIAILKKNGTIKELCHKYFGNLREFPVCSLHDH